MPKINKEALSMENNTTNNSQLNELAIQGSNEHECNDAQTCLDPDSIRRFCQVWGEVGRAVLGRRDKSDNAQGKTRFGYPGGCLYQGV